jgi:hypothetical protein
MEELQRRLARHDVASMVDFDQKKNRVRCFAHIINICSSHVVASFTSVPRSYLARLDVPLEEHDYAVHDDLDDDALRADDSDDDHDYELTLPGCYSRRSDAELDAWMEGIKRDPLNRARRVIRLLRSSDEHRTGFQKLIQDGNQHDLFASAVPEVQLLRDVKTRWDSVYNMLSRLRQLRPVSLGVYNGTVKTNDFRHRLSTCTFNPNYLNIRITSCRTRIGKY